MAIPFSRDWKRDTLIWKENKKHEFSVKSAYEVAIWLKQGVEAEHSRDGEEGKLWKLRQLVWKKSGCGEFLQVLPPTPWNRNSLAVGVPLCPQCVVVGWRKSAEMHQQCTRFFPALQVDAKETDTGEDGTVVHYNLDDLECKAQSLLSKCSVTIQSDIWRGPRVACYIPDPVGYSSYYVTGENFVYLVFVSRVW